MVIVQNVVMMAMAIVMTEPGVRGQLLLEFLSLIRLIMAEKPGAGIFMAVRNHKIRIYCSVLTFKTE